MKVMNVRRVALLLLVAFVVAVAVGAVLPKPVMAEVTSVLTGGKSAAIVHPNVWDGGCTRCYDHSIPGHWEYGVWIPMEVVRVCHYYTPCPIE
ncbi:MAG TPA: hypothetical protein VFB98_04520 [Candidatus Deferrimicrobium sp.]|nr:hypothetical protein [Candidatus Deferrimicrobium sp.]